MAEDKATGTDVRPDSAGRQDSEENYRRLFERVPAGVYRATPEGSILAANPALLEMLGYDSLEDIRQIDLALDLYEDPSARAVWAQELERKGWLRNREAFLKHKDGRRIVVLESASVVRDEVGNVLFYEGTLIDITRRKRAQEVQSVLLSVFEAAGAARDLHELLEATQRELGRLTDTSNFYVALYDEETGLYSFPYHLDDHESNNLPPQALPKSLTDYVRRTGQPLLVDEETHQRLIRLGEVGLVGVPSPIWLGAPLVTDGEVIGVVAVQSYQERTLYTRQDLELLSMVAKNIAQMVQRKRAEIDVEASEKRFRDLFEASPDAIFVEDRDGNVLDANPAAAALQGLERERLIGMNVSQLVPSEEADHILDRHRRLVEGDVSCLEALTRTAEGRTVPIEMRCSPLEHSGQQAVLIQVRDISERKEHERRLEYLAKFDAVTGLPNRFLFEDRLQQAILANRRRGRPLALHYLDLDEFKLVNDTLGHSIGDELLKAAGQRLAKLVRESDTIARLGGDEFAVIQTDTGTATAASAFAVRLLEAMLVPYQLGGHEVQTSTSIGIAISSPDTDSSDLLLQADQALYKAKERGRGSFQFFDEKLAEEVQRYLTVRGDLNGAIQRGELFLEYQPQVSLNSGEVVGCEALVRWRHPREGVVQPHAFIAVAENTGLIIPIGAWILREACRQRRQWSDSGLPQLRVAVNLSAAQFRDPLFAERLQGVLTETGVRPDLLELELTETLLMTSSDSAATTLQQSHERGISIAIDDFGTGYSSLQYLREFPIRRLKIAMGLVQGATENSDDAAIVAAVISLGHKLGMQVLAEGVETEEQVDFLKEHDCDQAQGFYFGRPIGAGDFARLLATGAL